MIINNKLRCNRQASFSCQSGLSSQSGFSIVEVLIAVLVIGLTLTALVASLSYSIALTTQARYRDIASKKAQEGLDFFKRERVILGWGQFEDTLDEVTYCLETIPAVGQLADISAHTGSCADFDIEVQGVGPNFKREVEIDKGAAPVSNIEVVVRVSWPGGETAEGHTVQAVQELYQW